MRLFLTVAFAILALTGCAATKQQVSQTLESKYVGQNVDALVSEFGPPASTFKMNSGDTAYTWQLSSVTDIDTYKGSGTASTFFCKVNVISSPKGIVTKLTTEDVSGTRGILGDAGR